MPLQGQWERQNTPLRRISRRERRLIAVVTAILLVGVSVVLYAALDRGSSGATPGCVDVIAASTTGGATLHACGPAAAKWCHSSEAARGDALGRTIRARCRSAGYR